MKMKVLLLLLSLFVTNTAKADTRMKRPDPTCGAAGIYETVSEAQESCDARGGTMYMWGESSNGTAFEHSYRAGVGPYWCTGAYDDCGESSGGFGYVGDNSSLPDLVSAITQEGLLNGTDVCDKEVITLVAQNIPTDITCSALQRHCEKLNNGWLIYAKSFKTAHGRMLCSGGCQQEFRQIEVPEGYTNLLAWPLILMYIFCFAILIVATKMDYDLFQKKEGHAVISRWLTRYVLCALGYVDFEGNIITFESKWEDYFKNLFQFFKCKWSDIVADPLIYMKRWLDFLSVFILSLGVALLLGGGVMHEQVCSFNALPQNGSTAEDLDYSTYFDRLFTSTGFSYSSDDKIRIASHLFSDPAWWTGEILIILFSKCQGLILNSQRWAGNVAQLRILITMLVLSLIVTGGAALYTWSDFDTEYLLSEWLAGFISAVLLLEIFFSAISHCIAKAIIVCFCISEESLRDKERDEEPTSSTQAISCQTPNSQHLNNNSISTPPHTQRETFKIYVPDGMSPGQQISVLNPRTNQMFRATIPSHDQWIIETVALSNDEIPTHSKPYFDLIFP